MTRTTGTARLALATSAIAAAVLIGAAVAQPVAPEGMRKAFETADVNKDGVLNIDEYAGHVIYVFKQIDRNGDGVLTEQEVIAFNPAVTPAQFRSADRNGDGRLSVGEAVAAKVIEFFEMDVNRDGVVSFEELTVYERSLPASAGRR